ncbi:MAG TPA: tRNA (adenosine(37)-N6)-dimethylallyltransferase MiaA, partial [Rhodoferax sp.]|nr:tRNA (adenosine(37)-N6)-dimethylallyltransferase MiaA [Rhodoferax sp.]
DLSAELPAMRCVGYRQAWEWLGAHEARAQGAPPPIRELRDKGIFATRQLAKRQLTWLRSMPARRAVACDDPMAVQQVLALVQAFQDQSA